MLTEPIKARLSVISKAAFRAMQEDNGSCPAWCAACGARHEERLEPDADECTCAKCGAPRVASALRLLGYI